MNLLSSLALSDEIPALNVATCRAVPPAASSTRPNSMPLSDTFRFTSFSSSTVRTALMRSSVTERSSIVLSFNSTVESVPLKS